MLADVLGGYFSADGSGLLGPRHWDLGSDDSSEGLPRDERSQTTMKLRERAVKIDGQTRDG